MYRARTRGEDIECDEYVRADHGVDLYREGEFVAFVPYANLYAVVHVDGEARSHSGDGD